MKIHNLVNSFLKNYPSIDIFVLDTLLRIDPTVVQNSRGLFVGRYGVWIGNMCANGNIKLGDIPELKSALVTYDKNKSQLPNIKDCKSLSELIEWVKDLSDDFKPVRKQSDAKENLEKVYEDNEWVVYVPHSHAAARRGGEGTHWCTASENDYYYNYYSKDGPLYINIRKSDGAKFQFHFESDQFMDSDDEHIQLNKIGLSKGAVDFYTKIDTTFKFKLKFDWVDDFKDGFAAVKLNDKWNFINTNGQFLSQQWFDGVDAFNEGFAVVGLNDKCNFINTEGQLLSQQWFDWMGAFKKGFAMVHLNGEWNFINTEGKLLSMQWFDWTAEFNEGFAEVELNDKRNFINVEGQFLSKEWFDITRHFRDGFAEVILNGKYNFINTEGRLVSQQWFDSMRNFNEGFAIVWLNGKWNYISTEGKFLSQQWFDYAWSFREGFARIKLDDKWNFINTGGQILSQQWFDDAGGFSNGFAEVNLRGKWSLIDAKGQLLPMLWFGNKVKTNST